VRVDVKRALDFVHRHELVDLEQKELVGSPTMDASHVTAGFYEISFFCNWKVDDSHATITTRVMIILLSRRLIMHLLISFRFGF
jgi:hypothetical protein